MKIKEIIKWSEDYVNYLEMIAEEQDAKEMLSAIFWNMDEEDKERIIGDALAYMNIEILEEEDYWDKVAEYKEEVYEEEEDDYS